MISNTMVMQLAADAICVVGPVAYSMIEQEFQTNLCRAFVKMLDQGRLVLNLAAPSFFSVKNNERPPCLLLPPSIRYMPEHNKARLRATYTRTKQIYRPRSTCLSREQRSSQDPIGLSGSDASVNVMLWPTAMQVNLGHEYISHRSSSAADEKKETGEIVRGAIEVLNALVAGLNEKWLLEKSMVASGEELVESEFQPKTSLQARATTTFLRPASHSQTQPCSDLWLSVSRISPVYAELDDQAKSRAAHIQSSAQFIPCNVDSRSTRTRAPTEVSEEYKNLVCDTFIRTRKQAFNSFIPVGLVGTDSTMNVALYPRVLMAAPSDNTCREDEYCLGSPTAQDTDETVLGAIERLNALVNGVGYDWMSEKHASEAWQIHRGGSGGSSASLSSCFSRSSSFAMMTPPVGSQSWSKAVMK